MPFRLLDEACAERDVSRPVCAEQGEVDAEVQDLGGSARRKRVCKVPARIDHASPRIREDLVEYMLSDSIMDAVQDGNASRAFERRRSQFRREVMRVMDVQDIGLEFAHCGRHDRSMLSIEGCSERSDVQSSSFLEQMADRELRRPIDGDVRRSGELELGGLPPAAHEAGDLVTPARQAVGDVPQVALHPAERRRKGMRNLQDAHSDLRTGGTRGRHRRGAAAT